MMDATDERIWADVLAGDARAFGTIWDRHRSRIFRHLLGGGATQADAEDLTAATFLELWRRRRSVRFVDGSVLPWLIVTARNVGRNAARARRRYDRFLAALPAAEAAPDPADHFPVDDRTYAVRDALRTASPVDGDLLAMTALEGFTVADAAAALGLSASAAKMRLSRLRARVRDSTTATGTTTAPAPATTGPVPRHRRTIMMDSATAPFSSARSDAIREALIATVAEATPTRARRRMWAVALVLSGALVGAGGAAGAFAATGALSPTPPAHADGTVPFDGPAALPAPTGVTPGTPLVSDLGTPTTVPFAGTLDVPIDPPPHATHLRVMITPTTPGELRFGFDAAGNNPAISATAADITAGSAASWMDFPVTPTGRTLYLRAAGMQGIATLQWTVQVPTQLGVNARGETYGVASAATGAPDLVQVVAFLPDGSIGEGYARAADLDSFSPDHAGQPGTPDEALAWQSDRDKAFPHGWDIPVFESDGVTQIGVFHIGG